MPIPTYCMVGVPYNELYSFAILYINSTSIRENNSLFSAQRCVSLTGEILVAHMKV